MTIPIRSPWLHQLRRERPADVLETNAETDVAIIGGGIAGVTTAYFLLTQTSRNVLLLEKAKVAHGATGHNAGHIVSEFERPFKDIVEEFGLERTAEGVTEVEHAWVLLDSIVHDARLATPMSQFSGYHGIETAEQLQLILDEAVLAEKAALVPKKIYVSEEYLREHPVSASMRHLIESVPHTSILQILESKDPIYIGAKQQRTGCVNAALLTEEIAGYLLATFPSRFAIREHSNVTIVEANEDSIVLHVSDVKVRAREVVLATNGFEKLAIINHAGEEINTAFHHMVHGLIGYMAGYLEPIGKQPSALSYPPSKKHTDPRVGAPYFYFTRRPYELEANESHSLVCAGGPEEVIEDSSTYVRDREYPERAQDEIKAFLQRTYRDAPDQIAFKFIWHGLMGYTPNRIRVVGREPKNKNILYNLGCNGIGILPSIAGALRIARLLRGDQLVPSIFDPKNQNL